MLIELWRKRIRNLNQLTIKYNIPENIYKQTRRLIFKEDKENVKTK